MRVLLDECLPRRLKQDLSSFNIAIIVLVARSNRFDDLLPLVPRILDVLDAAPRGAATLVAVPF